MRAQQEPAVRAGPWSAARLNFKAPSLSHRLEPHPGGWRGADSRAESGAHLSALGARESAGQQRQMRGRGQTSDSRGSELDAPMSGVAKVG